MINDNTKIDVIKMAHSSLQNLKCNIFLILHCFLSISYLIDFWFSGIYYLWFLYSFTQLSCLMNYYSYNCGIILINVWIKSHTNCFISNNKNKKLKIFQFRNIKSASHTHSMWLVCFCCCYHSLTTISNLARLLICTSKLWI